MIPAPFDYVRPGTVDEAVAALQEAGEDAKILAGGQSLVPLMKLRLAKPKSVIDLNRIGDLNFIREAGGAVHIGALATHRSIAVAGSHRVPSAQKTSWGSRGLMSSSTRMMKRVV